MVSEAPYPGLRSFRRHEVDIFFGRDDHIDEMIAKLAKINNYHVTLLAYFIDKLKSTPDGDGTLLDHSTILYGSSMSNPNEHNHFPLPLLLIGGASGHLQGGRHLKFPERTSISNMLVSILDKQGIHMDKIGDSTGMLEI